MAKIVIVQNIFLLIWSRTVLVNGAGPSYPDAERVYADMPNLAAAASYYLNSSLLSTYDPRHIMYHGTNASAYNRLSTMQSDCEPLDLSCKTGARESTSCSSAAISTTSDTPTHACSSSDAKRIHEEVEKEDGEQKAEKRQKVNTTATSMATEINTPLMDETEVRMIVEKFNRCFVEDTKISGYIPRGMVGFAEDLAQRGLASVHSGKIVELCMASEQWRGHNVFWRMLLFFMDTMSLEVATSNQLEDKKTVVLRVRKTAAKPLSECTIQYINKSIAKFRGAERMEMQCSLNVLKDRGTADVVGVFRWLLHHVKIECVGITCDLTEVGMNSAMFGRQMAALSKEWRESRMRIDSLTLCFNLAHYKNAAVIAKECPCISVLKIHFIGADSRVTGVIDQALEALLLYSPALEELSVFGVHVGIGYIQMIAAMLPHLVLLELELLSLDTLVLGKKEKEEFGLVFSGLKTLKLSNIYNYSCSSIEKFVGLFPSLKLVQIPTRYVATSLIDALSSLRLLRSLEIINGFLPIKTAEYLLEKLPTLECLSVGVKKLDNKLAQVLSKTTNMHTLKLRGYYTANFFASLLRPSPLMSTLKVLCVYRYSDACYSGSLSAEDTHSKAAAMKKFGCAVESIY
ncbi:hypothetical protein NECID01_2045 [Nematocida sp. AWRm77]|nr:hypothetical protein NECID01_2045 [Nematocida sp. AWRm77]